jgi:DNA-binding HxlR family transcriptional regulator
LLAGASRFNEIHRGLPGVSRALLSGRLRFLERIGMLRRVPQSPPSPGGSHRRYVLTEAGRAFYPVIEAFGLWALEWYFPRPTEAQAEPSLLLWRVAQGICREQIPADRVCIEFRFPEGLPSRGWIRIERDRSSACLGSPERDPDVVITASSRAISELWYGHRSLEESVRRGLVRVEGPAFLVESFASWFCLSPFAARNLARAALSSEAPEAGGSSFVLAAT